ncbi:MAG: hypothetical protein J0M12_12695, partial [Deltaproteobacteria bacterium]|nr:hypothetical protein [Deltaproteobacteria bacterium]
LTRSVTILWTPFLLASLWFNRGAAFRFRQCLYFAVALAVPLLLWGARNAITLGSFKVLGTQGGYNLPADYSKFMEQTGGVWTSEMNKLVLARGIENLPPDLSPSEKEVRISEWGTRKALAWIRLNPEKLPQLFFLKLKSLFFDQALPFQRIVTFLVLPALLALFWCPALAPAALILVAGSVGVMLTHNVQAGRFLVPMYPALLLLISVSLSQMLKWGIGRFGVLPRRITED